ncbi:hypothetical protein BSKO_12424 [Bryopsis sp. KO-2023]|nr:hypothetical protein BSKO_12424 [Bryopsis sp. KO-2023]
MDTKDLLTRIEVDGDIVSQVAEINERKRAVVGAVCVFGGAMNRTDADNCSVLLGTMFHDVNVLVLRTDCGKLSEYDAEKDKEAVRESVPRMILEAEWLPLDLDPSECDVEEAGMRLDNIRSHIAEWYVDSFFALKIPSQMGKNSFARVAALEKMREETEKLKLKIDMKEADLQQGRKAVEEHIEGLKNEHEVICEEKERLTVALANKQEQKKSMEAKIEKANLLLKQKFHEATMHIGLLKQQHKAALERESMYSKVCSGGWNYLKSGLVKTQAPSPTQKEEGKAEISTDPPKSVPRTASKPPLQPKKPLKSISKVPCPYRIF